MKLPIANQKTILRCLGKIGRKNVKIISATTATQLIASAIAVAIPALIGSLLDQIVAGTTAQVVTNTLWILAALVAANAIFTLISEYLSVFMGERIFQQLRDGLVGQLIHLPLSKVESAGTGDMLGRVSHDVDNVAYIARRGVSSMINIVATVLVTLVSAFLVSPILAPVLLLSIGGVILLGKWYFPRAVPVYRAETSIYSTYAGIISENATHSRTIESLGLVPNRRKEIQSWVETSFNNDRYGAYLRVFLIGGTDALVLAPLILVSVVGAWMSSQGIVTIGQVTTICMYVLNLNNPIQAATFWVDVLQIAQASLARIFGVDQVKPDREPTGSTPTDRIWRLQNVNFAYGNGDDVLKNVNLTITPGERLAIVGPSGAGKSTLARLIAGFDGPTKGSVTVGNVPMLELNESDLHQQVALVTQEQHVFAGTLAFNLRLVKPEATDEQLWAALDTVEAGWARELEDGIETKLGDANLKLDESQAQQLALARLVLMDPHTLVLDEATSMMDPNSARQIERSLSSVLAGRTVIMIAHRLSTAHDADRICVMDQGKIVELGSHSELLSQGGRYAKLWEAWNA